MRTGRCAYFFIIRAYVDSKTTKKYLNHNQTKCSNQQIDRFEIRDKNRKLFINLRNNFPESSRTELKKLSPAIYKWLYKNDKEWFINNLPATKRGYRKSSVVDWEKRDEEYSFLIIKEVIDILLEEPLIRVTRTKIYQRLDIKARFEKNLNKLTRCNNILQEVTENVEEYQIRRIQYFAKLFRSKNLDYTRSCLKRAAGIKTITSQLVEFYIQKELEV